MTKASDLEKLVDKLLKKVYNKQKMTKHSKNVKKIRKKKGKNKKAALHSSFKYADQMSAYNQRRLGYKPKHYYTPRRRRALYRMRPQRVQQMYDRTRMTGMNPFQDFNNIYTQMAHLDWIDKQQKEYNRYKEKHEEQQFLAE